MSDAFFNDDFFCTRTHSQFDIDAQRLIDFQLLGFRDSFLKSRHGRSHSVRADWQQRSLIGALLVRERLVVDSRFHIGHGDRSAWNNSAGLICHCAYNSSRRSLRPKR